MINSTQIDSIQGIDVSRLTFSDIRIMFGTGRSIASGSGREKTHSYRIGCQTQIGDVKADVWIKLAELLIIQAGEEDTLTRLIEYMRSQPWIKQESLSKIREKALELHVSRIFDNPAWVDYIPFNESWRPEILDSVELINVLPSCCQKAGRITENQIQRYTGEETAPCPHCGRLGLFLRIDSDEGI